MSTAPLVLTPRETVLVSRCLMGVLCRYHGERYRFGRDLTRDHGIVRRLRARGCDIVAVCPEVDAGLPVPRPPTRWVGERLICDGIDVTATFVRGGQMAVDTARRCGAVRAYLLHGSPSCDRDRGIAARLLAAAGVTIIRV